MEKRLQDCEHALERYEAEVLRCLDGESGFSQEMLARLIAKAEAELRVARQEYARVLQEAEDTENSRKRSRSTTDSSAAGLRNLNWRPSPASG